MLYKPVAMTYLRTGLRRSALLVLALALGGCSAFLNSENKEGDFSATGALPPAGTLYALGLSRVEKQDYGRAVKDFEAVEENYPYSSWTTHAQLMEGYAQYKQQNYDDAISALNRYIALHPENQEAAYAYYLKALCYYEQIDGAQRQQTTTFESIQTLNDVITRFPDTAYAHDARIKLRLAYNRLAAHDMVVGRFYEKQHLYAGAIGRFQDVITNYATTTYTAEALERLVECYLNLGLTAEAQRTASVLGYNYPGSPWYATAYAKLKAHHLLPAGDGNGQPSPAAPRHHGFWLF